MNPHLWVGLPGLATDTQTVKQKIEFRMNMYELKETRQMRPKTFANMVSNMLYERRFGPFFVEPIVAGLDPETFAPYICNMDLIGGVAVAESEFNGSVYFMFNSSGCITEPVDFVAGGTCEEQLMGMAETLWEPGMGPDQLFECISQAMMNAFDRDAISGWGAIVHIIEKDKVTQLDSTNVLSSDLIFQVTTRTLKTRMD